MEQPSAGLAPGLRATLQHAVMPSHLASCWGSGGVDVLATPQMIGWMEQAAVQAVDPHLPDGHCTVGGHVDVRHVAATLPGETVVIEARLVEVAGRRLVFALTAHDRAGLVGEGTHTRYVVRLAEFMARATARAAG